MGVAQVPWWCRFVFQGIQCHTDNQEKPHFLHDIRCVFPSGISSRKGLAKFAFQELVFSLLLPKIPKSGSNFGVPIQEFAKRGQVAAKCYFLGFTIPWKPEQSGTCILSSPSSCSSSHGIGHLGDQNISWNKVWEKELCWERLSSEASPAPF